jgi:hypothetical protein
LPHLGVWLHSRQRSTQIKDDYLLHSVSIPGFICYSFRWLRCRLSCSGGYNNYPFGNWWFACCTLALLVTGTLALLVTGTLALLVTGTLALLVAGALSATLTLIFDH